MNNNRGQILVGVIVMMIIMAIFIPVMVTYVQNEAKWGLKESRNMTAFQLAEAGVDRGYHKISESTNTWNNCQGAITGVAVCPTYYLGDQTFDDIAGGKYKIYISSGPEKQQVTIIGVGRDTSTKEVRAVKAVYANAPLGNTAIRGAGTVGLGGGNMSIEWGAVISAKAMDLTGLGVTKSPQFWSASSINPFKTSNVVPVTDSIQWHAYQSNLPPLPSIDLGFYASSASASSGCTYPTAGCPAGNLTCCLYNGNQSWGGNNTPCKNDTECVSGGSYYINGNLNIDANGIYVRGNLIVTGDLTLPNGRAGQGGPSIQLPQTAWQEYGNNWSYYTGSGWDPTAPSAFPGITGSYLSPAVNLVSVTGGGATPDCMTGGGKVVVNGFIYVGGNVNEIGGAGKSCWYGAMLVQGAVNVSPINFNVFYTDEGGKNLATTTIVLSRVSWQDLPSRGF